VIFSCLQRHWRNWRARRREKKLTRRRQRLARAS
jgi:multidrug efflux pump